MKYVNSCNEGFFCFAVFAFVFTEDIQWYEMCESTPASRDQAKLCFGDLASGFRILHHYCKEWTEDDVISVIDEITSKKLCCYFLY